MPVSTVSAGYDPPYELPHVPQHAAKGADVAGQQIVGATFQQVHGEEARPARHAMASIVRHRWLRGWRERGSFGLPRFFGSPHAAQYGSTLLRLTGMRLTALSKQQIVRAAFQQIHGEEVRPARLAMASIVRHRWPRGWGERGLFGLPGFFGTPHAAQYGSTLLRLTGMRLTALDRIVRLVCCLEMLGFVHHPSLRGPEHTGRYCLAYRAKPARFLRYHNRLANPAKK